VIRIDAGQTDIELIRVLEDSLGELGIEFDTGYDLENGKYDWYLDRSLRVEGSLPTKPAGWSNASKGVFEVVKIVPDVTNLRVLRASRRKPKQGDVFAMLLPDSKYLFGRVISTTARIGPIKDVVLIYIFRSRSDTKDLPDRAILRTGNLLLQPILTNRLPWIRGYFETCASFAFSEGEVLSQHCFRSLLRKGEYFDEFNNRLSGPIGPVGNYGLDGYGSIDRMISKALGLESSPSPT
jgi:hypothetical protein